MLRGSKKTQKKYCYYTKLKMVKELSSMDLYYLVKELKLLENSKVDRIYHTKENPEELIIVVHVTSQGKHILKITLPSIMYIDYSKEEQGIATGLCMMLRKYLEGSSLKSITQTDFERVIQIEFQRKDDKFFLILELFSKGNIIFCDNDKKILNLLNTQKWKDRELKKDLTYQKPKSIDIKNIDEKMISDIISNSNKDSIVKTLAMNLSLGGIYSEELCERAKIDKRSKTADPKLLLKALKTLLSQEIKANSNSGRVFPFELITIQPEKYYDTFSEAIAKNVQLKDLEHEKYEKQKEKISFIVEEQKKVLEETEKAIKENQQKADTMYQKYAELESIIQTIRDARKKFGWQEIRKIIKEDKKFSKVITEINEKEGTITIELDEL